jgi:hypothetical protein
MREATMLTPFGPRLIGETEKTFNALLRRYLEGTDLTEPQWVTLRVADLLDGQVHADGLVQAVTDRAQLTDAVELVHELADRGLIDDGRLTPAGRDVTTTVQATIDTETATIWDGLTDDDVAATTRVLNEVLRRARVLLG